MRRTWVLCTGLLGLTACQELPTGMPPAGVPLLAVTIPGVGPPQVLPLTCTKSWIVPWGSQWHVPDSWSPIGVPDSTDVVCISRGQHANLSGPQIVRGLQLDGDLEVFSHLVSFAQLTVTDTLIIGSDGELELAGDLEVRGITINQGTILGDSIAINSSLDNYGALDLEWGAHWTGDRVAMFEGTDISDYGGLLPVSTREFRIDGAEIPGRVQIATDVLLLEDVLGSFPDPLDVLYADTIVGDIRSRLYLHLGQGSLPTTFHFRKNRTGPPEPITNRGTLTTRSSSVGNVTLDVAPMLINQGTILVERPTTIVGGRVVNEEYIDISADLTVSTGIENHGTIDIDANRDLDMAPGSLFDARPGGDVTGGEVWLQGARLIGSGSLSYVQSVGGTIQPGAPYGTLSLGALELDALSHVDIEIAGTVPGTFDQLAVAGTLNLDGTLRLATVAPFTGGRCGQALPIITNTWRTDGAFQSISGLAQPGLAAWRVQEWQNTVYVTGHQPGNRVTLEGNALTVKEGGAATTYRMCMGTTAPTAAVVITPRARLGEVSVTASVTFDVADWMLPRTVTVTAIDDADVEGIHADTIGHTVTTTDPTYAGGTVARQSVIVLDNDVSTDLSLLLISQEDNQFLGDTMNTTFRVTNAGPSQADGAGVVSLPLVGLTYLATTGATCSVTLTNILRCALDPILAGGQIEFTIQFLGAVVGLHTNTLTVSAPEPDPDSGNNTVVYTQRVN